MEVLKKKKIMFSRSLLIALMFLLVSGFVNSSLIFAEEDDGLFAGASYVEDEVKTSILPYGVTHSLVQGFTSTSFSNYDADGYGGASDIVVPGKLYEQQVNVMEIPSSENVRITTWAYLNGHKWTLNTVRALIHDYEAKHPGWKVIGAINGDFFDINANGNLPYQTSGALVSSGEFYKTTTGGLVGFANDGSTNSLVGNKPVTKTEKMILSIYDGDEIIKEFDIDKVNEDPQSGEVSVYYAIYNSEKQIVPVEVSSNGYFVENAELALPNNANDFYGKGVISSKEAKTIARGEFAIVSNNSEVDALLDTNVKIRVQYKYTGAYENVNDISGGGSTIMVNGEDTGSGLEDRAPRTVIGRKEDGTIVMMVIDGRQASSGMYGADRTELGAIMNYYGAVEAYNLDGGGSSTMIIKQDGDLQVMNSPSDGRERTDANAILVVAKDPEISIETERTTTSIKFDIDLVANNNHDIEELYITLNNETKLVNKEAVIFTGLSSNTNYSYYFHYKNSLEEEVLIITSGVLSTYKLDPSFIGINIKENVEKFEFELIFEDPDNASSFSGAELKVDGRSFGYFIGGMKQVTKTFIPSFEEIVISATYNIGDGKNQRITITITEFEIKIATLVYYDEYFNAYNELFGNIYK